MLTSKAINSFNASDREVSQLQTFLAGPLQQVLDTPIIDGVLVEDIAVTSGAAFNVKHGLGRTKVRWMVVSQTGTSFIQVRQAASQTNANYATLIPSGTGTISLWFF